MQNQLGKVWGEYCVEVIRSGGASYYPFGEKPIKNIILDSFFQRILSSTGFREPCSIQTFVGACATSTGMGIPASPSDTGLHGMMNDITYGSSGFFREIITGENRIRMTRDFNFKTLTGARTYGEAAVGAIGFSNFPVPGFFKELPVSHFIFPGLIQLSGGDSLKIVYSLNLIVDYLSTGQRISLTGDGFNFNGTLKWAGDSSGVFNIPIGFFPGAPIESTIYYGGMSSTTVTRIYYSTFTNKDFIVDSPTFYSFPSQPSYTYATFNTLFGNIVSPQCRAAFITGYFNSGFGQRYQWQQTNNQYSTATSVPTVGNFQAYESGASIDVNYYFPPTSTNRTCSGIFLNFLAIPGNNGEGTYENGIPYIIFDTPQTIPAQQPISMKLRWYMNRL